MIYITLIYIRLSAYLSIIPVQGDTLELPEATLTFEDQPGRQRAIIYHTFNHYDNYNLYNIHHNHHHHPPCILPENLCGTFWQQESPAVRSLGLLMGRPAKSPGRSWPTPSNRDEMN